MNGTTGNPSWENFLPVFWIFCILAHINVELFSPEYEKNKHFFASSKVCTLQEIASSWNLFTSCNILKQIVLKQKLTRQFSKQFQYFVALKFYFRLRVRKTIEKMLRKIFLLSKIMMISAEPWASDWGGRKNYAMRRFVSVLLVFC